MRTTINLDDNVLADLKQMAARTGRTMTAIIEDAVRQAVLPVKTTARKRVRLTTVSGKGVRPGIDLNDLASVLDAMERRR